MSRLVPSDEQRDIIKLGLTSIKVRAGAGTGKTTTVAMVIANLIDNEGIEPEQVLGITFTNKAAAELAERVNTTLSNSDPARQVEIHTYHGFAAQVLAEFGPLAGVDSRLRVITPTFARQLLSERFNNMPAEHIDISNPRELDNIARFGDRLGDHLLTPDQILALPVRDAIEAERREMASLLNEYQKDKRSLRVVDFADLVTLATRVVTEYPELARAVRDRYRVVVLDEYQDTNPAQRALLSAIFTDGFPTIAVGDEDQTIYEWRGASTENFEKFSQHFPTPGGDPAHLRSLTLNRRSIQNILDVANRVRVMANPDSENLVAADQEDQDGEIVAHWAADAVAEADWIATTFTGLHDEGQDWKSMAVLFRKNKDFAVVLDAFARHDIPVEVANVGGLLSVPEVADLRAWLTLLERPGDGSSLTRILMGSRYRLGMADLAVLTRSAVARAPVFDDDDADSVSLLEVIEDETALGAARPEARVAYDHFRDTYQQLVRQSQGLSLVEVCRLVLDITGAWQDAEALPDNQRLTARLNLYRMLDLAEDWSPLRGRPSLHAFLEYLDAMEDEPGEDLDAARLSEEDAVTFITVHRAKGLEWETVALPAVVKDNFPSVSRGFANPLKFPHYVPTGLRIDGVFDGVPAAVKAYDDHLRRAHTRQEWRTAYVAVTRARRRLYVSGAYWYGQPETLKNAKQPSELWEIVREAPGVLTTPLPPVPDRPENLRLPEPEATPDPVFPDGWAGALRAEMSQPGTIDSLADELGVGPEYRTVVQEMEGRLFQLDAPAPANAVVDETTVSVTGLVTYAQCPKRYFWSNVDPLPRRANPAATRGTEIHRRIELHQRGHVPLDLVDADLYDFDDAGDGGGPSAMDTYLGSRFAGARATLIEAPFVFALDNGYRVRGRIDAVYTDGRRWEVVDFKSGRMRDDPARLVQLQAYAVAVEQLDFGLTKPEEVVVTFAYLGGGGAEVSHLADQQWLAHARADLTTYTGAISEGRFPESPGEWCSGCDFLRFCETGQEFLGR